MEDTRDDLTLWVDTVTGETRRVSAEEARRLTVNMRSAQALMRKVGPDPMKLYRQILEAVTDSDYAAASLAHEKLSTLLAGRKA